MNEMNDNQEKPLKTQDQVLKEIYQNETNPVNDFLEEVRLFTKRFAQNFGYYDINDAISFTNSNNLSWKDEAVAFSAWYDNLMILVWNSITDHINNKVPLKKLVDILNDEKYYDLKINPSRIKINI